MARDAGTQVSSIAWLGIAQLTCWQSTHRKASNGITADCKRENLGESDIKRKATEVIIDQFQLLSDAKGGSNTAPATERYAEEDTKSAKQHN